MVNIPHGSHGQMAMPVILAGNQTNEYIEIKAFLMICEHVSIVFDAVFAVA